MKTNKDLKKLESFMKENKKIKEYIATLTDFFKLEEIYEKGFYEKEVDARQVELLNSIRNDVYVPDWFNKLIDSDNIPKRHLTIVLGVARSIYNRIEDDLNPNGPGM